jgi:hypothetical protein
LRDRPALSVRADTPTRRLMIETSYGLQVIRHAARRITLVPVARARRTPCIVY